MKVREVLNLGTRWRLGDGSTIKIWKGVAHFKPFSTL